MLMILYKDWFFWNLLYSISNWLDKRILCKCFVFIVLLFVYFYICLYIMVSG